NDPGDRRKADAADRLVRHGLRTYQLQEYVDLASRDCLLYGSGFLKMIWDSTKGEIAEFDEETGEIVLTGDISISVPNPRRIFLDPDAETWSDVRYVFERVLMPYEEACMRWPDKEELLKANLLSGGKRAQEGSGLDDIKFD